MTVNMRHCHDSVKDSVKLSAGERMKFYRCLECGRPFKSKVGRCTYPDCRSTNVEEITEEEYKELKKEQELEKKEEKEGLILPTRAEPLLGGEVAPTLLSRFLRVLEGAGIARKKTREIIAEVFFNRGDYENPKWLNEVLEIFQIPAPTRKIIITAYFGKTPKELEKELQEGEKEIKKENGKKEEVKFEDIKATLLKDLKEELEFRRLIAMIQQLNNITQQQQITQPQTVITWRQKLDENGNPMVDAQGRPILEPVYHTPVPQPTDGGTTKLFIELLKVFQNQPKSYENLVNKLVESVMDKKSSSDNLAEIKVELERDRRERELKAQQEKAELEKKLLELMHMIEKRDIEGKYAGEIEELKKELERVRSQGDIKQQIQQITDLKKALLEFAEKEGLKPAEKEGKIDWGSLLNKALEKGLDIGSKMVEKMPERPPQPTPIQPLEVPQVQAPKPKPKPKSVGEEVSKIEKEAAETLVDIAK